jgi:hypothetical protein
MGATKGFIHCVKPRGGHVAISYACAGSDTAGTFLPLDTMGVAVAASATSVVMPNDVYINDITGGPATGSIEILVDGQKTGLMTNLAGHVATNTNRTKFQYPVWKGQRVQVRVIADLAA